MHFRNILADSLISKIDFRTSSASVFGGRLRSHECGTFGAAIQLSGADQPQIERKKTANRAQKSANGRNLKKCSFSFLEPCIFTAIHVRITWHHVHMHGALYRLNTGPAIFGHQHVQGDIRPWSQPFACGIH